MSVSRPLSNRYSLMGGMSYTAFTVLDSESVGILPERDLSGRVALTALIGKGNLTLTVGGRSALNTFPFFSLSGDYRFASSTTLELSADWSGMAEESAPLQVGGVKDRIAVALQQQLTQRNSLTVRGAMFDFRDQWRNPLGSGYSWEAEVAHRITFSYPELLCRLYGGYYHYRETGLPEGDTLTLLPAGAAVQTSFFVPQTFTQAGFGVSAGTAGADGYSSRWRPYGSLDLLYNSRSGVGFRYELGTAGPIFGMDRLAIGATQESGRFGSSDLNSAIEMNYRYLFN